MREVELMHETSAHCVLFVASSLKRQIQAYRQHLHYRSS